jgi:glycosyltransferase involved in cell wall biosynthesis
LYPDLIFPGSSQFEPGKAAPRAGIDPIRPWTWRGTPPADATLAAYWSPVQAPALWGTLRGAAKPVIGLVHNALPHERLPAARFLARRFLSRCDGILALSDSVAGEIRALGFAGPLEVTPHPTYDQFGPPQSRSDARSTLGLAPDHAVLLFFGLVRRYKGLDVLLEALPEALEANPELQLVVAGEFYDDAEAYRAQARDLGIEAQVRFTDRFVPDDEVADWFAASDLVVQPYRSATQSGVVNVAAHYGKPLVVSGVGGLADSVRSFGAGIVVAPDDPRELAQAIGRALEPETAARLAEGSRRMGAAHGWDPFCERLESLIARLR